jgi:hypothetical protein
MQLFRALLAVVVLSLCLSVPATAQPRYALDLGFDFTSGDYGTDTKADSLVTTLGFSYFPNARFDLRLAIPWLYQNEGITTATGGIRLGGPGGQAGEGGAGNPPRRPFAAAIGDQSSSTRNQSGLGDITLAAGYVLLPETDTLPQLRPHALVKLPTAEENMGTGEYDLELGLALSKWLTSWYLFGDGSVVFQGGKVELGLRDFATYEAGLGYPLPGGLLPTLSLWGASSPAATSSSLLEARLTLNKRLSDSKGFSFTGSKGLSNSSPDYGVGGSLFINF